MNYQIRKSYGGKEQCERWSGKAKSIARKV